MNDQPPRKPRYKKPLVLSLTRHMMERYPHHWDAQREREKAKKAERLMPPAPGKVIPFPGMGGKCVDS